jgi:hypothetical protein
VYQGAALEEVQAEHAQYFEALQAHPRTLVGAQVPSLQGEGMEVLQDAADAKEWQEAVKQILVEEVRDRAATAMDENAGYLNTIHASIELFTKNTDLIPGTVEFDVDLANRFATLATPYELRADGKLQGYSIPVQPIIDQLRTQLAGERAKATASPPPTPSAAGTPAQAAGAAPPPAAAPAAAPPQAGIESKAGSSAEVEDFSTLFGTIGLPNLRI